MSKVSEHFDREEFACHCGCGFGSVDVELLGVLEDIRARFKKPIKITSPNRCRRHNNEIGGAINSYHTKGMATDIIVKDTLPEYVYDYLCEKYPDKYGIGKYNHWTHIDVRDSKSRWDKTL